MSYKGLTLNRGKIEEAIKGFSPEAKVAGPQLKSDTLNIYTVKLEGQNEATINVYHNKDGTTSLTAATGKNHELSDKIAKHVVEVCDEYKDVSGKSLYVAKMSEIEFVDLLEFLRGFNATIEDGSNISHGKQYKVSSPYGDYLYLNKYNTGSFQVQGVSKIVKSWVVEGLINYLPYKDVIDIQLASLEVEVSSDKVLGQLQQVIPTAYGYLGDTLLAITSPSIALQSIEIELKDYTAFVFPALKGLEGYLKKLFLDHGIMVSIAGFGEFFDNRTPPKLNIDTRNRIKNDKISLAIERSYFYYKRQRHGLFHVDGLIEPTRTINTKQEAQEIIREVLDVIEQTYSSTTVK